MFGIKISCEMTVSGRNNFFMTFSHILDQIDMFYFINFISRKEYELFDKTLRPCQQNTNMEQFLKCFRQDFLNRLKGQFNIHSLFVYSNFL